jgi:hypothetical protein
MSVLEKAKELGWSAEHTTQAIDWFKDCVWADYEEDDFDELSIVQVLRGVSKHYSGGIAQFIADGQ